MVHPRHGILFIFKKNEMGIHVSTQMKLVHVKLSEKRKSQKTYTAYCLIPRIVNIQEREINKNKVTSGCLGLGGRFREMGSSC